MKVKRRNRGDKKLAQATTAAAPATETNVNTFLAKVYLLMVVGLAVTGLGSYWISEITGFESPLVASPILGWELFIVQVILVHAISLSMRKIVNISTKRS